ncbi:trypsin-like serine protease [Linderina pennispora]|uniref:Trypsin-like serine protease n=1 Tax=Linderina pennispora TaxID=61395 RepID=A0A1Y1WNT1_9FUNG|nr:trypsin-like serine protease [Linderina pennispora]ORX74896.1 trypsin-like serine protease [Linderina pennispora]
MNILTVAVSLALASAQVQALGWSFNKRVIGGGSASPEEFPFLVTISRTTDKGIEFICGGSIIHKHVIVTAASCFTNGTTGDVVSPSRLLVGFGNHNRKKQLLYPAIDLVVHPEYEPKGNANNIALVSVPALPLDNSNVAKIPVFKGKVVDGSAMNFAGWGSRTNATKNDTSSDILRKTIVKVGSSDKCRKYLKGFQTSNGPQTCTQNSLTPNSGACGRDWGSGLVGFVKNKPYLIGLASHGTDPDQKGSQACAQPTGFGVYTHVNYYIGFIANTTNLPASTFY